VGNQTKYIRYLDFDTKLFGYKVGRIANLNPSLLESVLQELPSTDYKLIYVSIDPNEEELHNLIEQYGGTLMDEKVTFERTINTDDMHLPIDTHIVTANSDPNKNILDLALQSGIYSRFYLDPHFKHNEYQKLYEVWLRKSLSGEIALEVFVYQEHNEEIGLITINKHKNSTSIGLLAVDIHHRGKSIGRKLMYKAIQKTATIGLPYITVTTQKKNEGASKFYTKIGFHINKIENIYHIWLN